MDARDGHTIMYNSYRYAYNQINIQTCDITQHNHSDRACPSVTKSYSVITQNRRSRYTDDKESLIVQLNHRSFHTSDIVRFIRPCPVMRSVSRRRFGSSIGAAMFWFNDSHTSHHVKIQAVFGVFIVFYPGIVSNFPPIQSDSTSEASDSVTHVTIKESSIREINVLLCQLGWPRFKADYSMFE